MLINEYNKIKSYGFKQIYGVNINRIKKYIFSKKCIYSKSHIFKYLNRYPQYYFIKNFLPKINFKKNENYFKVFNEKINLNNKIDWHQGWPKTFYKKINIKTESGSFNKFTPDIKLPWEISRLQFLPAIAIKNDSEMFQKIINSWINENPFLIGVNWINTMEIAIRAINLIYSFYLFKDKKLINNEFWKRLINSLYEHAFYIENNFEIYYKHNNHYIADLLGYFYLCFFFDHEKKYQKAKIKTYKKLLKQFDLQVQEDGTCYEGSTNYHKLTTEMFMHFYLLCKKNKLHFPENLKIKLNKAQEFLKDCTDFNGNLVQIGDNDSGKILSATPPKTENSYLNNNIINHYSNFGLTIIKNKNWHITYRHPTYNKIQPTGHFHQDDLSITLSYNGIPILIDPGSYVYTSNKKWRDLMRSHKMHNTFYIESKENNLEKQDIFLLNKTEKKDSAQIKKINRQNSKITIKNYATYNQAKLFRELIFDNKKIEINDSCKYAEKPTIYWNFIFHPNIKLKEFKKNKFEIYRNNEKLLIFESSLNFKQKKGFYAPKYGLIQPCSKLFAQNSLAEKNKTILYSAKT